MVNSENKANEHDVSEYGEIFLLADLGIDSLSEVSFELVYAANESSGGSYPKHEFYDSIDCWVSRTPAIDSVENLFHKLSFKIKLYAFAEIFCRIGNKDIPFDFEKYDIDGYLLAHMVLCTGNHVITLTDTFSIKAATVMCKSNSFITQILIAVPYNLFQ